MTAVILVTGSRSYAEREPVRRALAWAGRAFGRGTVLRHGAADGLDALAAELWAVWGQPLDPHPADWSGPCRPNCRAGHRKDRRGGGTYCPTAGNHRNGVMCRTVPVPLVCVAFPLGGLRWSGTRDCMTKATQCGITVVMGETLEVVTVGAWSPTPSEQGIQGSG